jgi:hypothetical protein
VFKRNVFGRIRTAEPIADECHRRHSGGQCPAVRGRVDSEREPGYDRLAQSRRKLVGKCGGVAGWSSASDNRNAVMW